MAQGIPRKCHTQYYSNWSLIVTSGLGLACGSCARLLDFTSAGVCQKGIMELPSAYRLAKGVVGHPLFVKPGENFGVTQEKLAGGPPRHSFRGCTV